jgi:hypothetical protein
MQPGLQTGGLPGDANGCLGLLLTTQDAVRQRVAASVRVLPLGNRVLQLPLMG